jgi:hypothetical protein
LLPLPLSGFVGANEPVGLVGVVVGRLFHFSKYPNFHDFCKDNLVAFRRGLESQSGVVVRLSVMLMGLPVFATLLLARARSDAIDPETRLILQATAEGNPPSVWSQTDCETAYSTRSSRSIE